MREYQFNWAKQKMPLSIKGNYTEHYYIFKVSFYDVKDLASIK
jgi:hypothetical protein